MKQYTRKEMNERLRSKIAAKKPLVGAGAGTPLIAKILDEAGCDFVFAYCTGEARIGGFATQIGTMPFGDADERAVRFARQASRVVEEIPIICGIGPGDPTMDVERLTDEYIALGYSGVINFPTAGGILDPGGNPNKIAIYADSVGYGMKQEAEQIAMWNRKDIFSYAYAFYDEAIKRFIQAGVDVIIPHLGLTGGGLTGSTVVDMDDTAYRDKEYEKLDYMVNLCKKENPNVIIIGHGGILAEPEDMRIAYERTDVQGFIGASSTERIPIEYGTKAVMEQLRTLKKR